MNCIFQSLVLKYRRFIDVGECLFATEYRVLTTLAIAGWRIRLECPLPAVDEAIAARYRAFVVPDGAANDAWVTVSLDPDVPTVSGLPGW